MAAALAVGACGVVVGTRFIASEESGADPAYKQAVVEASPDDIVTTDEITGQPATWLRNSIRDFHERPELGSKRWRDLWSAGQSVAQTTAIQPVALIVEEMVEEYVRACRNLQETLSTP
jgi:nitronate monooxygenase